MVHEYDSQVADLYADEMRIDVATLRPIILDILERVGKGTALDFGCGSGRFSIVMAKQGAKVTAIDLSPDQIEIARKRNNHKNIAYAAGGIEKLEKISAKHFDFILMNMLLPSLENKEELEKIMEELSRVIKNRGKILMSFLHPLSLFRKTDIREGITNFDFKRYYDEGHHYRGEVLTSKGRTMIFRETHFSLDFITKVLKKNNLVIERIRESAQMPEDKIYTPTYLIFELAKR